MKSKNLFLALMLCAVAVPAMGGPAPVDAPVPAVAAPAPAATSAAPAAVEQKTGTPVLRVGFADLLKIAGESNMGKVAKTHFEAKADRFKSQIDTKQKLLEKQKATLEAKLPTYTPQQRAAKIKEYEKKVEELRTLLQKADREMKPMQEELLKEVYGKIEKAASEYGAANGFSIITDRKDLLYVSKDVAVQDVTEALIKYLNGN